MTTKNMSANVPNPVLTAQQAAVAKQRAKDAQQPTNDLAAQLAAMQTQMAQFAELLAQKDAQIAELKTAKPASKAAPKSPITCKNCTWKHDEKAGTLTITVDLNADIIDPTTNKPKVSSTGVSTAVAQLSGSLLDKNGRKVGLSLNAYHKL